MSTFENSAQTSGVSGNSFKSQSRKSMNQTNQSKKMQLVKDLLNSEPFPQADALESIPELSHIDEIVNMKYSNQFRQQSPPNQQKGNMFAENVDESTTTATENEYENGDGEEVEGEGVSWEVLPTVSPKKQSVIKPKVVARKPPKVHFSNNNEKENKTLYATVAGVPIQVAPVSVASVPAVVPVSVPATVEPVSTSIGSTIENFVSNHRFIIMFVILVVAALCIGAFYYFTMIRENEEKVALETEPNLQETDAQKEQVKKQEMLQKALADKRMVEQQWSEEAERFQKLKEIYERELMQKEKLQQNQLQQFQRLQELHEAQNSQLMEYENYIASLYQNTQYQDPNQQYGNEQEMQQQEYPNQQPPPIAPNPSSETIAPVSVPLVNVPMSIGGEIDVQAMELSSINNENNAAIDQPMNIVNVTNKNENQMPASVPNHENVPAQEVNTLPMREPVSPFSVENGQFQPQLTNENIVQETSWAGPNQ